MNGEPIIQVKNVTKSYPVGDEQISVLKGINLQIASGSFATIVGPSGNGKSTLLNMITGIDHPTSGQVIVAGQALHNMSENALAAWRSQHMGIVFQFFQLIPSLNLMQNVIMPMDFLGKLSRAQRKERALHLLDMVGLADEAKKLPSRVSGGQQQRAAIARALANDPPLVVADEPTGNLDNETSEEVFRIFSHLVDQGKTMIMVTHNLELAQRVPLRIEIVNGQVAPDLEWPRAAPSLNGGQIAVAVPKS